MLYGPLPIFILEPSIVIFGPLGAGSALGLFRAFGRLLRVLRPLFAHRASLSVRPSAFLGLVVSVTRRCHARDEAGARGSHEEERDHAHGDGGRPKAPQAKEVAYQAEHHPHEPGREVHARAQDREDDAPYAEEQAYEAADPAHEQL